MARLIAILTLVAVLLLALPWISGCGSEAAISSTTVLSVADTAPNTVEIQTYRQALQKWVEDYLLTADREAFDFEDPEYPTGDEMDRVLEFAESMHASIAALKKIGAPSPITQAHAQLCVALATEVSAMDRLIMAIENKNQRDAELAFRRMSEARGLELQAIGILDPYLDVPAIVQN
ncbi:MAG TPA: hypothetical protein VJP78_01325 [Thermoleophilia bacterium]|nr:hypothetical protein [Thermoleophilia bacterium]